MKINMNVRWKNKTWLVGFLVYIVNFIYGILERLEIVPVIDSTLIEVVIETVAGILVGLGILIDPTTKGVSDSERALEYTEPN